MGVEMSLPLWQFLACHGEGDMELACAVMRRDHSAGKRCFLGRRTTKEEQQYVPARDVQGAEAPVLCQHGQLKNFGIELFRAVQILDIQRGLFQIGQLWQATWDEFGCRVDAVTAKQRKSSLSGTVR